MGPLTLLSKYTPINKRNGAKTIIIVDAKRARRTKTARERATKRDHAGNVDFADQHLEFGAENGGRCHYNSGQGSNRASSRLQVGGATTTKYSLPALIHHDECGILLGDEIDFPHTGQIKK